MNTLEKDFINYNQALEMNALGFDEPCFVKVWWLNSINRHTNEPFNPHITINGQDIKFEYPIPEKHPLSEFGVLELQVPTFSQAFRFFRDNHNLHHEIEYNGYEYLGYVSGMTANIFKTYEEAESACLDKLIELAKSK